MANRSGIRDRPPYFRRRSDIDRKDTKNTSLIPGVDELRSVVEGAGMGIIEYHPLTGGMEWNGPARGHFGLSPDAPVNYNVFLAGLHPADRSRVIGLFDAVIHREHEPVFSAEFRTAGIEDHTERLIAMSGQAFFDQGGEAVSIAATTREITDRKQEGRCQENVLRAVFDSVYEGILLHASDGSIVDMNQRFLELYRVGREQLLKMSISHISAPTNRLDELPRIWARVMAGQQQLFEWKAKRPVDGSTFDVEVFLNRIEMLDRPLILATVRDISDRKRLEEALQQSEERYRLLFDKSPLPKWVVDLETYQMLEMNNAAVNHYGYSRREFMALSLAHIRTPDEFESFVEWAKTTRANGERFEGQVQTRHRKKTGEVFDADVRYTEIVYNGRRAGLGEIIDITERKRAEDALRESEGRYRALIGASSQALYRMSPDWSSMRQLQGGSFIADTVKPNTNWLQEYIHPDDQKRVLEAVSEAVRTGTVFELEHRVRRVDGTTGWTVSRAVPMRNAAGDIVEWFGAASDITARKKAEEALLESEARLRQMADAMPQLVWTARPDGTVDYYNRRVNEFQGFEQNQDGSWHWSPVLHPDDVEKSTRIWQWAIERGETYQIEHRVRRRGGSYRWYLSRGEPARDASGRIVKWFGTATDIDDLKQAQAQLKRTVDELERSNRELQQFAYVASHDLQEPLRTVGSYVELLSLKYKGKLDATADRYIGYASEGANRMSALINDLLAYSRVGTKGRPFERVDMHRIFKQSLGNLRRSIKETGARISADPLPPVMGDDTQLVLLMQNLLANAVKFRKPDTVPEIRISARREGNTWVFGVRDNGIGIEPRFFERIFVIFQRLHTREEYSGTGIGLAICRRIVERHGGRIWVESTPGEGAAFYFTLKAA